MYNKIHPYDLFKKAAREPRVEVNQELGQYLPGHKSSNVSDSSILSSPIIVSGSIPNREIISIVLNTVSAPVILENCIGTRYYSKDRLRNIKQERQENLSIQEMIFLISQAYLEKPPCPRLFPTDFRTQTVNSLIEDLDPKALIYHDLGFCDYSSYDYLQLYDALDNKNIPFLRIKSENAKGEIGQSTTRIEAFVEMLS